MLVESCAEGHRASKSSRDPKIVGYNPRKWLEMAEITSFVYAARVVHGNHRASKYSGTRKSWVITHENGQKWPKSRVVPMPLESCTGGHRASQSSRVPKIVGYIPRKRQKNGRNHEFCRFPYSHVLGVRGHRNPPGTRKS